MQPLDFHAQAKGAAQAALAAHAQGKFLEMNTKLFENQRALGRDQLIQYAKDLGLDVEKFTKDMDSDTISQQIARDMAEATGVGSTGTPATFVNGRFLSGAKPFNAFKEVVDEELAWAKAGNRPQFTVGKNVSETKPAAARPSGPDPNKVYDIPIGGAPVLGPATAKVTILHYLDYQ
jgi:protein-disulfide isomerase